MLSLAAKLPSSICLASGKEGRVKAGGAIKKNLLVILNKPT
jgi:hypothetical protein